MNLPDLKHLEQIIKLCKKRGVQSIKIGDIELTLSEAAPPVKRAAKKAKPDETQGEIESDELSANDLLMWSVGGGMPFNVEGSGQ